MANHDRPNLFSYATSELSQDAFICWLAAWADPKFQDSDPGLHQTARDFVVSMIHKVKPDYDPLAIKTVHVQRQVEKLDILIEINRKTETKLAILVEDKTHTDLRESQKRYPEIIIKKRSYTSEQIIPIFFKTGYQSRFDNLGEFKPYVRKQFLDLLQEGSKTVKNNIYCDFLMHLANMESAVNQFLTKNLTLIEEELGWNNNDRKGLFMALYEIFSPTDDKANWGYVANASGGFFGFWWNFESSPQGDYWSYLQLEGDKLCYKIGFPDEISVDEHWKLKAQELKSIWTNVLLRLDNRLTTKNTKIGKTMTVAKVGNILVSKPNNTLDLEKTLTKLREAQEVMKKARQSINSAFPND